MRTNVSLCEMCRHRDWHKETDLQDTWAQIGREPFSHVWCDVIDGPREMRWETCPAYEGM